jgi:hypothetical protein
MKAIVATLALCFVLGCSEPPQAGEPLDNPKKIEGAQGYLMGEPITHRNATFIPVLTETAPGKDEIVADVITLAEAKKNGWVEIIEIPGDEQVQSLRVRNNGPKPLLLLAGDLLLGGKQDRIVAKDVMVAPGETRSVSVYCVEQGRWSSGHKQFDYSDTMAPDSVRKAAQYDGQQSVWDNVGAANAEAVSDPKSSSIREFVNDKETREKIVSGVDFVLGELDKDNVVGVLFVLNGEIKTFELFGSPSIFSKAIKPVLESFLAEAAIAPESETVRPNPSEWSAFIGRCLAAGRDNTEAGYARVARAGVRGNEYKSSAMAPAEHGSYAPDN